MRELVVALLRPQLLAADALEMDHGRRADELLGDDRCLERVARGWAGCRSAASGRPRRRRSPRRPGAGVLGSPAGTAKAPDGVSTRMPPPADSATLPAKTFEEPRNSATKRVRGVR